MAKTKARKKFHKIVIHHNRWMIWAIAYVIFVAIALLGYLKLVNYELDQADNVFRPMHSYIDQRLGFGLLYPADWSIEAAGSSVMFLPSETSDEGVTFSVTAPASEKFVRTPLKITKEEPIHVFKTSGSKITNELGEGHFETVIIVPFNNKLYVIRGSENHVQKVLQSVYFLK